MQSLNQKTEISLPSIRRRQAEKNKDNETDYFNLLFEDGYGLESTLPENLGQRERFFQRYHFYFAIVLVLFIAACFLVVQMVVNGPEIEKYKTATKNIEEADSPSIYDSDEPVVLSEDKSPVNDVPDVQFARNSVSKPVIKPVAVIKKTNPVISKRAQIAKSPKIVIKSNHVIAHRVKNIPKKVLVVKVVSKPASLKKTESKVNQAIEDIMLRPLVISSEPALRGLHKNT